MLMYPRWKSHVKICSYGAGEALFKAPKKQCFPLLVSALKGEQEISPLRCPPFTLTIGISTPPYSGLSWKLGSCNKLWGKRSSPVTLSSSKKKEKGDFLAKPVSLFPSLCCLLQGSRAAQAGGGSVPAGCGCGVLSFWHCLAVSWACSDFVRCSLHTSNSLGLFSLQSTAATLPTRGKQSKAPSGSALPFSNTSAPLFLEGQGSGFPPLHSCFIGYRSSCVHFPLSCLLSATTTELTWLLG